MNSFKKNDKGTSCILEGGGEGWYTGYIGMCGPKGYGFSAALVIK